MPSMRLRFQPKSRFRLEIRPSLPVRHLISLRNRGRRSTAWRAALWRPLRTMATNLTPRPPGRRRRRAAPYPRSAVTAVGARPDQFLDPFDGWGQQRAVGRVADMEAVIHHDPVRVVEHLAQVAELDRLPIRPF